MNSLFDISNFWSKWGNTSLHSNMVGSFKNCLLHLHVLRFLQKSLIHRNQNNSIPLHLLLFLLVINDFFLGQSKFLLFSLFPCQLELDGHSRFLLDMVELLNVIKSDFVFLSILSYSTFQKHAHNTPLLLKVYSIPKLAFQHSSGEYCSSFDLT